VDAKRGDPAPDRQERDMAQLDQLLEPYNATRVAHGIRPVAHPLSLAILRAKLFTEVLARKPSNPTGRRR
jgi:hypothetical protein